MNSITVLIADDDHDDRMLIQDALARKGLGTVKLFSNGEELLRYLQTAQTLPALILLDLNMPLKNGFECLTELRANTRFADVPIVVMSTSSAVRDRRKCEQLGCSLFISKPWSVSGYDEMIDKIFSPDISI